MSLAEYIDELQANGRYFFTYPQVKQALGTKGQVVQTALLRLKQKGRIVSPRREFYVIVPVEYKKSGCPPASWFIDDLMKFMGQPYYVGLLSAAAIHGAAHQQPMLFQVVTDRPTKKAQVANINIEFHIHRSVKKAAVTEVQTETGFLRVSSTETTAFDLVRYMNASGYLNNVATVLSELSEKIKPEALLDVAPLYSLPDIQRLGYLFEMLGALQLVAPLSDYLKNRHPRKVVLAVGMPTKKKELSSNWNVILNETVEADL